MWRYQIFAYTFFPRSSSMGVIVVSEKNSGSHWRDDASSTEKVRSNDLFWHLLVFFCIHWNANDNNSVRFFLPHLMRFEDSHGDIMISVKYSSVTDIRNRINGEKNSDWQNLPANAHAAVFVGVQMHQSLHQVVSGFPLMILLGILFRYGFQWGAIDCNPLPYLNAVH